MKTIAEMIPEYESNLDALRSRRLELLDLRKYEPHFEVRHRDHRADCGDQQNHRQLCGGTGGHAALWQVNPCGRVCIRVARRWCAAATATHTARRNRRGAAERAKATAAGTVCASGRMSFGRSSWHASRSAGTVPGAACGRMPPTLTTLCRTTATGQSLSTRTICKACAIRATAPKPSQKAGQKQRVESADRPDARTGAARAGCARTLAGNPRISRTSPTLKVSGQGA